MGKSDLLKNSMKGGLNSLLTSTTPEKHADEKSTAASKAQPTAKEPAVHCNFLIDKSIHKRMKFLAIERNMSLRDIVNEAMTEYLEKYEK